MEPSHPLNRYRVPILDRTLDLLELLTRHPEGMTLTAMAEAFKMPKNSVFRIATTLTIRGYSEREEDTKVYRASRKLLSLGYAAIGGERLVRTAGPILEALRDATGETALLGTLAGGHGVVIDQVASSHPVKVVVEIGHAFTLHTAAPAKAMMAYWSVEAQKAVVLQINPLFPALRSGHQLFQRPSRQKQIPSNQQLGDPRERAAQWKPGAPNWNPVWDEAEVAKMECAGIAKLRDQQNPDGGWGWFSAFGHQSYAHTTAVVMHGLLLARDNGAKVPDDMIQRGLAWLAKHEESEADKIAHWEKRKKNTKPKADSMDALVRRVLGEGGKNHPQMLGFLFRDKNDLPVYAKALTGLEFHRTKDNDKRDEIIRNIRQFLKPDEENQTAYLDLGNGGYWWYWYGSEYEAQAWFLKLLAAAEPESPDTRGLVKYLINNRSHATYREFHPRHRLLPRSHRRLFESHQGR